MAIGTLAAVDLIGGGATATQTPGRVDLSSILPASVNLTAFTGGITVAASGELYPSASGNLSLIADQSVNLSSINGLASDGRPVFGMLDVDPSAMPSPVEPNVFVVNPALATAAAHDPVALHGGDVVPARIYSLNGDIVDGMLQTTGAYAGLYSGLVPVAIDKAALIQLAVTSSISRSWGRTCASRT